MTGLRATGATLGPAANRIGAALFFLLCPLFGCGLHADSILPREGVQPPRDEVVFLGDSLTAGVGLPEQDSFPALIGSYWSRSGISFRAVNEGVGGDTTFDILRRLDDALTDRTLLVFLEVGANDGFRHRDVDAIRRDLYDILDRIQERGIRVVLAEMWLPMEINATSAYRRSFDEMYAAAGVRFGIPVMPYFLRSIISQGRYWQRDGIHPTAEGTRIVAQQILSYLNPDWNLSMAQDNVK